MSKMRIADFGLRNLSHKKDKKKQESKTVDPAFDAAYEPVLDLERGSQLIHKQGCYRKKRFPGCP